MPQHGSVDRDRRHRIVAWRVLIEAVMRAMGVEVVRVLTQYSHGVPFVVEQEPVGAFFADGADESLGVAVRTECPWRCLDDPRALGGEDGVERWCVCVVPRSRRRNRNEAPRSPRYVRRLRATWAVQAPVGCAVTPRVCTVPGTHLRHEEDIQSAKADGGDVEEIDGQ